MREKYRSAGVTSVNAADHSLAALDGTAVKCKPRVTVGNNV